VGSPLLDDELGLYAGCFQLVEDQLGLLDRDQAIGVAVDDQGRRIVGRSAIKRAEMMSGVLPPGPDESAVRAPKPGIRRPRRISPKVRTSHEYRIRITRRRQLVFEGKGFSHAIHR